jgi:antitoxin VapB
LRDIGERCAKLPVLDDRTPDEILGYDEHGLPH